MGLSPKKILYVSPNAHLGGAEKGCEIFLKNHDRTRFLPVVAFLRDGPLVEEFRKLDVEAFLMPKVRVREVLRHKLVIDGLVSLIKKQDISLVHSVMSYGHLFGGRAAKKAGIKNVWFQHGPVSSWDRWISIIRTNAILVNSSFTASEQKKIMLAQYPVKTVLPGAEEPSKLKDRSGIRHQFGFDEKDIVFGITGRLDPWKGQLNLVKAFREAYDKNKNIRGLIVGGTALGSTQYENQIKNFLVEHKLQDVVRMVGFVPDINEAYAAMDVFVHTSLQPEPFGLVIVEAMMRKIPVIAASNGGVLDIVEDQKSGVLCDPHNIVQLAARISELAESPEKRAAFGKTGFELAVSKFTARQFTQRLEAVYDQIISENKPQE